MLEAKFVRQRKMDLKKAKLRIEKELAGSTQKIGNKRKAIFPDIGNKEDESAQEVEMYESSLSIEKGLEQRLADINKALEKIKKNNYGKCEKCNQEISLERLAAYPAAALCVKCLEK